MRNVILLLILLSATGLRAQDRTRPVFDDSVLPDISITLDPGDLARILAPGNELSDEEFLASFTWSSPLLTATVDSVGFRLRGNTSRQSQKKSFKISFNAFRRGGDWLGLEKLNINGEHNDPSIMRSKLAWDLMADMGIPASRSNHVRLFVNGDYYGLYMNVEHVDEVFLQRYFGGDGGNLYKALYPADLTVLGADGAAYRPSGGDRRPYDLTQGQTDEEGYEDLARFISVVNNTSNARFAGAIQDVFNVDGFLKAMAVTVLTGSWDSYWFLMNNYYLYNSPETGKWEYVPFDLDNSFGIWWSGIWPGIDWANRDVYEWGHPMQSRPLTRRILSVPEFRERYTYHLRQAMDLFEPARLEARVQRLKALTERAAEEDPFRPLDWQYTVQDYHDSFTLALAGRNPQQQAHVTRGLLPYISQRYHAALGQLDGGGIAPFLTDLSVRPVNPRPTDAVGVAVSVEAASVSMVEVEYWFNGPDRRAIAMLERTDLPGRYEATVPPLHGEGYLDIRVRAVDGDGLERLSGLQSLDVDWSRAPLYINELMALNGSTLADEAGEFDDWVELYNGGSLALNLGGMTLTDKPGSTADYWSLPSIDLPAGDRLVLWMDGQSEQGPRHAPFRLSGDGESLALYDATGQELDYVEFGAQSEDVSWTRNGDGHPDWMFGAPTPGQSNVVVDTSVDPAIAYDSKLEAYPNPFHDRLTVDSVGPFRIVDVLGREVFASDHGTVWDASQLAAGIYLLQQEGGRGRSLVKVR